jgi:steroid delta-isomerase-like uncharacterized protein
MTDPKQIVRLVLEEPWTGSMDVIDEHVAPGYVLHDPSEPEPLRGPEGLKGQFRKYLTGFPDARITVDDQFAEGDHVATRWTARGTHEGEIAGISATGKEVTVTGLTFSRLENDKLVEEWATWDTLGMLVQLGVVPARARA